MKHKDPDYIPGPGTPEEFNDIPGTTLFDMQRSRQGYHLNMFCMSLMKPQNRAEFKANEAAYLQKFPMSPGQREAVLKRDWNRMIELGGNVYFLAKLFSTDGLSYPARGGGHDGLDAEGIRRHDAARRPLRRR